MERITLVSSSIEETWPLDGKMVFLGKWCLPYSKIQTCSRNYEFLDYHWDKSDRFYCDAKFLDQIYEEYISKVSVILNRIHGTNYSQRYWRINLGWWLIYFIEVLFDRWRTVIIAAEKYPLGEVKRIIENEEYPAVANSSIFFDASANNENWNERLSSEIFEKFTNLKISNINLNPKEVQLSRQKKKTRKFLSEVDNYKTIAREITVDLLYLLIEKISMKVISKDEKKVSLESTYLKRNYKLKLFFCLKVAPKKFVPWDIPESTTLGAMRKWLFPKNNGTEFAEILEYFLPRHIPKNFLENYSYNKEQAEQKVEKFMPEIILTANDFAANDPWKFWASECIERGSKLIVSQHGGSYGSAAYLATQTHEIAISDRFLSWGWIENSNPKIYRAPAMKLIGSKKYRAKNTGLCLLVTTNLPRRSYHLGSWPIGPQMEHYFQDQFRFVSKLSEEIRKALAVRLFPHDNGWEQHARWKDFDSEIKLLSVSKDLNEFLKSTKVYIATNNATTFLEAFASGIPTIIYWDRNYWEINENSKPYFKILKKAKIFFDNPEDAAMHLNSVWADVPLWWNSKEVKSAVELFSDQFAYRGERPLVELKSAILNWN